jgi:hypothetical protein
MTDIFGTSIKNIPRREIESISRLATKNIFMVKIKTFPSDELKASA